MIEIVNLQRVALSKAEECARLLRGTPPAFRFHQIHQDIVNAREVALAFGFEPVENLRVEADAHCDFPPEVAQPRQICQLLVGQGRNVPVVDVRVVARRLASGSVTHCLPLLFSPSPVPDIFGSHAFQPCAPR